KKFSKFPDQLQPLALRSTSRCSLAGGEFYSVTTCCQLPFFTAFDQLHRNLFFANLIVQLFDYQGVFRSVCARRGANYREI
ncbi:MAG: hypothetical protein ABWZ39_09775, partial [Pseudomonas caspiana]